MSAISGFLRHGQCVFFGDTVVKETDGRTYAAAFSGELYGDYGENTAEYALNSFIKHGIKFVDELNGAFAIAVWDSDKLYLFRDRSGLKRNFYHETQGVFVFASDLPRLSEFPGVAPEVDEEGLAEIFAIGPARTPGFGVFKGVKEVLAGGYVVFGPNGLKTGKYWDVTSAPHTDGREQTLETTRFLLTNAITGLLKTNPLTDTQRVCSMLSGGLDSSIVSAVAQRQMKQHGKILDTFSFDFTGNTEHFKGSAFQPEQDAPWALKTAACLGTNHTVLECSVTDFTDLLFDTVDVRGLPGMTDIDSSLLYFLKQVATTHTAALTGECADEIFGGYPWFSGDFLTEGRHVKFPWSNDMNARSALLSNEFLAQINLEAHAERRFEEAISQTPVLHGETAEQTRRRQMSYINLKWFMATLCERLDKMSAAAGILPRAPFADHRLIEYIWNVPWELKRENGTVKSLLREAFRGILPNDVLFRKKSPFPKSYNPQYEQLLAQMLNDVLNDSSQPITGIIDKQKARRFMLSPKDLGKPWFGQLMAGPQMMAYVLQVNYWLKKFKVTIAFR